MRAQYCRYVDFMKKGTPRAADFDLINTEGRANTQTIGPFRAVQHSFE